MLKFLLDIVLVVALIMAIVLGISGAITKNKKTLRTAGVAALIWLLASSISAIISNLQ